MDKFWDMISTLLVLGFIGYLIYMRHNYGLFYACQPEMTMISECKPVGFHSR